MGGGGAGRRYRIIDAANSEGHRQGGGIGARHRGGDGKRTDAFWTLGARGVGGGNDRLGRRPARPHDNAGAIALNLPVLKTRISDRLLHGHPIPGGPISHKAAGAAVDGPVEIQIRRAVHLAAEPQARIVVGLDDSRFGLAQGGKHFLGVVADARYNSHAGDHYTPHSYRLPWPAAVTRPLRRCRGTTPHASQWPDRSVRHPLSRGHRRYPD